MKFKRLLAALISAMMIFSMMPALVLADEADQEPGAPEVTESTEAKEDKSDKSGDKESSKPAVKETAKPQETKHAEDKEPEETQKAEEIANELRWYKKMVEEGLITKEQYDRKERELLGK